MGGNVFKNDYDVVRLDAKQYKKSVIFFVKNSKGGLLYSILLNFLLFLHITTKNRLVIWMSYTQTKNLRTI